MVQCCCCVIDCCVQVEKTGPKKSLYESLCACCAKSCSFRKCMATVPWAPLFAIILLIASGVTLLTGLELVTSSVGVVITATMGWLSQGVVLGVILVDLVFVYSVCSNKLRVHNVHWNAEGCGGYRIKDAAGCCGKLGRCICKMYNGIIVCLSWTSLLLMLALTVVLCWFSGCTLFLVALCQLSQPAIGLLLNVTMEIDLITGEESPISNFVYVDPGTNSSMVCDQSVDITRGSFFILGAGPVALLAQIIMTLSYFVTSEVSWRHMKDVHREEERAAMVNDGTEMRGRMGMGCSGPSCPYGGGGCPYGGGAYGGSEAGYGGGMGGGSMYGADSNRGPQGEDPYASGQTMYADAGGPALRKHVSEHI